MNRTCCRCHSRFRNGWRAPLRVIDSFAEILVDGHGEQLDQEALRLLGTIRSGSQKMDQLIVGLLEFSRIGREQLDLEAIDMTLLAQAALVDAMSLYTGPSPNIEIRDLPEAAGDSTVMRQVWCNLIGNALKYSAKRPAPKVTVGGHIEGREAIYQVEDNGAGFDMRYAEKLFRVIQRLHRADEFTGTGVGLAIVQRIIVRHGGRIWARGEPDAGACFCFALPARP